MKSRSMENLGLLLIGFGTIFLSLGGAYFYQLFQYLAEASTTGTSSSSLVGVYSSMLGVPIVVTLSIIGLGVLIIGGFFVASAHITQQLAGNYVEHSPVAPQMADVRPARLCTKCGSLLYQSTAFCPNCGNQVTKIPSVSQ